MKHSCMRSPAAATTESAAEHLEEHLVPSAEGEDLAEEAEVAVEEHLVPSRRLGGGLALRPRGTSVELGRGAPGVTGGEATEGEDLGQEAEVAGDRLVPTGATVDRLTEEAGGG